MPRKKIAPSPGLKTSRKGDDFSYRQLAMLSQAMDYFQNRPARMGVGTPSLAEGTDYVMERLSYNYWLLLTLYRNHWLARRVIDTPARDMTKHWARIESQINPEQIQKVDRIVKRTNVPAGVRRALEWAFLYGGAGCLMVIKGHERFLDSPLDIEEVGPESFRGLIPFDRWIGISPVEGVSENMDDPIGFGLPEFYQVRGAEATESFKIHASRILRFYGPQVPTPELEAQQYWGISKLEILFEELRKRDNASWAMLQLLFRAQILARRDPDLAGILSGVGKSQQALKEWAMRMQTQNELLSNQSMLVLGKDGEFWSTNYSFAGMAQLYAQFQMDMAGAADMPVTKLFGRTITGLGQSNDMDERNYEEKVAMDQSTSLDPCFSTQLYPVLFRSTVGEVPDDFDLKFPSVRVLTEEEKGDLATKTSAPVIAAYNSGAFGQKTLLKELRTIGDTTGIFTNITDEMISKASDDIKMFGEEGPGGGGEPGGQGGSPGSHAKPNPTRELKQESAGAEDARSFHKRLKWHGLDVSIENEKGSVRSGVDAAGTPWAVTLKHDYGYLRGTPGSMGIMLMFSWDRTQRRNSSMWCTRARRPTSGPTMRTRRFWISYRGRRIEGGIHRKL